MVDYRSRITALFERIAQACQVCGRNPEEITLVAVSKTHPAEVVQEAINTGLLTHLGENRVQEGAEKIPLLKTDATWHLIGTLQRNKARKAMELFDVIQSVDSLSLAQKLSSLADELGCRKQTLLEVNTSGEASKAGCLPSEAKAIAEVLAANERLGFSGLMTVGPLTDDRARRRRSFEELRLLAEDLRSSLGLPLPVLSMGMTDDLNEAILEGSTMVRVGTAIFGHRDYGGVKA